MEKNSAALSARTFSREAYGRPLPAAPVLAVLVEESQVARGGGAIRRQYRMSVGQGATLREIDVLEYMPHAPSTPPGVFIGINFLGNQSVDPDPEILITRAWLNNTKDGLVVDHHATEASRGAKTNRWPVDTILKSGFGLVTFCYGDVHPDRPDGRAESVLVALGRPAGVNLNRMNQARYRVGLGRVASGGLAVYSQGCRSQTAGGGGTFATWKDGPFGRSP